MTDVLKLLVFDLDDTLVNFAATRTIAHGKLAALIEQEDIDPVAFLQACTAVDRPLFSLFEQGVISRADYRSRRFEEPFARLGLSPRAGLVSQLNQLFMDCVNDSPLLYDDVWPAFERAKAAGLRMAILTNGPSDGQRRKLKATGLGDSVDHVAIGEEIGFSKPHAAAFQAVIDRFGIRNSEALMVGDSPTLDYDAALSAGLQALLLDRDGRADASRRSIRTLLDVVAGA
jgi:putative hydrolase of the HAD superfamily